MSDYPEIAERFKRETANHVMTVLHDDGLYRHVRFMQSKTSAYWFDLITIPGTLFFQGDGDSYTFRRIEDMFAFFRDGSKCGINPHYWSEKLTSDRDCVMKYDQDLFEKQVKEHVAEAILDRTAPRGISRAIKEMFEDGDITWEGGARRALEEFEYAPTTVTCTCAVRKTFTGGFEAGAWGRQHVLDHLASGRRHRVTEEQEKPFQFEDTWEWSFKDYDWWFLWACHAIVWGIAQYDASKKELVGAAASGEAAPDA
ncbi:hypothetical protein [Nonomuraea typhae]|uniref:Uncharacterized protein n=1 Tax=Nonomuraea typhae TaxID=2603600 RepID=A0ABW7YMC3_9ACTN